MTEDIKKVVFENQFQRELNSWNVKDEYKYYTLDELQDFQKETIFEFKIATFNVDKGLNVGSMMRTAACYKAQEFIIIGDKKYDRRSTVGAQNYVKVSHIKEKEFGQWVTWARIVPVFIETTGIEWNINKFAWHLNTLYIRKEVDAYAMPCFIFGSESEGIPKDIIKNTHPKLCYNIPTPGVIRSLNVASACAIICNDIVNGKI